MEPHEYLARECGADKKYIASGVPDYEISKEVKDLLGWQRNKFMGGYYAKREEERGQVVKV